MQTGERILIIEDNEDVVTFLTDNILHPHGYDTLVSRDGQDGLRRALEESPDLILLDLNLPRMTGLEVLKVLQKRGSDIPVILMTFYGSEEIAVEAFRLGVKNYIVKPFKSQEVLEAVEAALGEDRLRHEKKLLTEQLMQSNKQLEQRVRDLTMVYEMTQAMTKLMDLETLLSRLVEAAVYLSNADEGILFLLDEETQELYLRAAKGVGEKYARGLRLRVDDSLIGRVVTTGEPLRITSPEARLDLKVKTGYLVNSLLYVPLRFRDEIKGVLGVSNRISEREFTPTDQHRLNILADHAVIALENARLYEGEQRRAFQLAMTSHLSHRIASILDVDALLSEVVELLKENLGYYYSQILLQDGAGQLAMREGTGKIGQDIKDSGLRVPIDDQTIVGWAANHGQPLCANDVRREPLFQPQDELASTRAELAVPLLIGSRVIGVLDIHSDQRNAFDDDDQAILQMLGDQIAVAIETAALYERVHARPALTVFAEIGDTLASARDLDDVVDKTMKGVASLINAEAGSLLLLDESGKNLDLVASLYGRMDQVAPLRVELGQGIAGWVAQRGQPVLVNDPKADPRHDPRTAQANGLEAHSILCTPLKIQDRVIGVIELINKLGDAGEATFDDDDLQKLKALAFSVALSLENAELRRTAPALHGDVLRETLSAIVRGTSEPLKAIATTTYALKARSQHRTIGPGDETLSQLLGSLESRIEQLASLTEMLDDLASRESTAGDWADLEQRLQKLQAKYSS
jgi:GAF domain-containing protein/FixJ family two-component response regulator